MPFRGKGQEDPEPQAQEDSTSNEAAVAEVNAIITADATSLRPYQRAVLEMLTALENMATEDTEGIKTFGDDIGAILLAETEAEMWEADELPRYNAKVLSGCELALYGIEVKFSDDPEIVSGLIGPKTRRKMFLLVQSARLNSAAKNTTLYRLPNVGDEFRWNTSARFIVTKLYWLQSRGYFDTGKPPVNVRISGTELGAGQEVVKLKPLDAPVIEGHPETVPF